MRKINPFDFYQCGVALRDVEKLAKAPTLIEAYGILNQARSWLEKLLDGELMELTFSRYAAQTLHDQIKQLMDKNYYGKDGRLDLSKNWNETRLPEFEIWSLKRSLEILEHNLAAESRESATYVVSRIGIYDTAKLVDAAEAHLTPELRKGMPEMALSDYHDSGRCMAFGLATASGFHAARAVEAVLVEYYRFFAGKAAMDLHNMGEYIVALEKIRKSGQTPAPTEKTIRAIREIKDFDRNPLMHPRDVLDGEEAASLFALAGAAITAMMREVATITKGNQPPLLLPGGATA